jgi:hypothetical protein
VRLAGVTERPRVLAARRRLADFAERYRWAALPAAATILVVAAGRLLIWTQIQAPVDWQIYRDAALRWQAGGSYFLPSQLDGPYTLGHGEILYPPVALWLLVPFSHLPDLLWWVVPVAALVGVIAWWRPRGWPLVVMAACTATPVTQGIYLTGRPTMWIAAFFALGLVRGGWAVLVLLKPSVFPFALVGIRRRWWWISAGILALLCLPFPLELWRAWVTVVLNSGGGVYYSILDISILGIPIAAWLGRTRGRVVTLTG